MSLHFGSTDGSPATTRWDWKRQTRRTNRPTGFHNADVKHHFSIMRVEFLVLQHLTVPLIRTLVRSGSVTCASPLASLLSLIVLP